MQAPARLIANNAGVEGDVIVEKLFGQAWEQGYNAMDDRIENLMEAGIIDPAKVPVCLSLALSSVTGSIQYNSRRSCLASAFMLCRTASLEA